jgi:NAD(P)-dependent dehydrogenase (short-subunit alcohol dehydrogenase family)
MAQRTIQQLFSLSGKTALVTGGSRGLGLQVAYALGEAGAKLVLSSRKEADLKSACEELKKAGIDAQWVAGNCADDNDVRRIAQESILKLGGHVDILVS